MSDTSDSPRAALAPTLAPKLYPPAKAYDVSSEVSDSSSSSSDEEENRQPEVPVREPKHGEESAQKKPARLIANVLHTQYDVVKEVLGTDFHCKLSVEEEGDWDILWADTGVTSTMIANLRPYQKINHYHGMSCLARKNHLGRNLMRLQKIMPKDYNFFPSTWLLPTDWNDFKAQFGGKKKSKTYILKPEALSQGKGIFLVNSCEGISLDQKYVAQRYLTKPYLIEGLKFDLRIYVLVYGCDPLRIYIYKEGLARLATEQYVPPDRDNLEDMYIHLTNYAINKNSENFVFNTDPERTDIGHKRSLTFVWKYIDSHGGNSVALREQIKDCIVKTLCAVQPLLCHTYRSCQALDDHNNKCFEILGFDVLLDHKLKPWLLEVNHSPSFTTDTPFDHKIKADLLRDVLNIVKLNPERRAKYYRERAERQLKVTEKEKSVVGPKMSKEERAELRKKKMEKRDKHELAHCGGFTRIYPECETGESKYEKYILAAQGVWDEFTGAARRKELIKKKADVLVEKPKRAMKTKSLYKGPINRKPLYYIKSDRAPAPAPKEPENVQLTSELLLEALRDPIAKRTILARLAIGQPLSGLPGLLNSNCSDTPGPIFPEPQSQSQTREEEPAGEDEERKSTGTTAEQLARMIAQQPPMFSVTELTRLKDDLRHRGKKPAGPGAFLVPKVIQFDAVVPLPPMPKKSEEHADIHKLWRKWK